MRAIARYVNGLLPGLLRATARYPLTFSTGIIPRMQDKRPQNLEWHDVAETVVSRIHARLEVTGLSAQAVSTAAGLSKDAVRDVLRLREPGFWKMAKIAAALGCDLNYFDPSREPAVAATRAHDEPSKSDLEEILRGQAADDLAQAIANADERLRGSGLPPTSVARLAIELFLGQRRHKDEAPALPQ